MDRSLPDYDKHNLPMEDMEEMEVIMTTQLESLLVTREDAIQTQTEETDRMPSDSVGKNEDCGGEESNKCFHPETSNPLTTGLPEMNSHNLSSKKEVDVTMVTDVEHVSVTRDDATPANIQTQAVEMGAVQTAASAATLPVDFVCETECPDEDSDSDSSSSSSSSSTSSSSSSSSPAPIFEDDEGFSQPAPIKARDEVLVEELPAVEDVSVTLPEEAELQPVGTVSSIVQQLVIIQSLKDTPPLNEDSILFRSDRVAVGKVFEVFGPVYSPLYILRFNSSDQISSKGLTEGLTVYYAPALKEYTEYILTQQLKLLKGSDASWKNDEEPPEEINPVSNRAMIGGVSNQDILGLEYGISTQEKYHPNTHTHTVHLDTQRFLPHTSLPTPLISHLLLFLPLITLSPHQASLSTVLLLFRLQLFSIHHSPILSGLQTLFHLLTSPRLLPLFLPHHLTNTHKHASLSSSSRLSNFCSFLLHM
ncbi:H/ACA ribonucleoprotein complex non-core subunit NAF1 isoform X2 [Girardinichthys multiradiatus]|uniref:H/ACA ribonucleoprotein complex non-core subunit NAF1 isoform X2 n=1 Tax=Girardinichthys multiradiatus TaxID=208333 RepID=UPI001FAC5C48|nr:H/ACA ribonucleoprotein complex non-core subunit NAF1 isoform X2 [Girardinichthys multiradiatus]